MRMCCIAQIHANATCCDVDIIHSLGEVYVYRTRYCTYYYCSCFVATLMVVRASALTSQMANQKGSQKKKAA